MELQTKRGFAAAYIRVSTQDQVDGLSLDVQEKLCKQKAKDEGYEMLEVLKDEGISGHNENRPGIKRLKELVAGGSVQAVVALSSDRLFRNVLAHMEAMEFFKKHDIQVIYVNQASMEDNAASIMQDSVLATVNEFYRNQISDKVKGTLYAKVEAKSCKS